MAHVFVVDSTARRTQVKVSPSTSLFEILATACTKLGRDPSSHGFKHNQKKLDLSLTFRLSGLITGSKLELIQVSKSPSAVLVALQTPAGPDFPTARLSEKFASTISLWLILRHFESAGPTKYNFTAKSSKDAAGALTYEQPVLTILNRRYETMDALQQSLAKLGITNGSVGVRLSFERTSTPHEAARKEIDAYFNTFPSSSQPITNSPDSSTSQPVQTASESMASASSNAITIPTSETAQPPEALGSDRPIEIFAPPTSSTPFHARQSHTSPPEPSIAQLRQHQEMLAAQSINKRLPSNAELAIQAREQEAKLAAIKSVKVKIRYPDQSTIVRDVLPSDTPAELYAFVRSTMAIGGEEPLVLAFTGDKGKRVVLKPEEGKRRLIKDCGIRMNTLLTLSWDEGASADVRGSKSLLKPELAERAKAIQAPQMQEVDHEPESADQQRRNDGPKERKGGVPKWLKLGKK
ncbi:MAG: hypothetical protein M1814_003909 [Vezdaea aestivalis]|nr:MAG: hypothetical protein M1814_003909 [Vezdaea aestivalis]